MSDTPDPHPSEPTPPPTEAPTGGPGPIRGQERRAIALVLGSAFSLQFGAALAVLLQGSVGPVGAVTLRMTLGAAILLAIQRPRLTGRPRRDWMLATAFGLTLGAMNVFFYEAAARLPLGAAVTFEFLGPLLLAVVTSRRFRDVVWVVFAAAGVWLLHSGGLERLDLLGIGFALAAGACWVGYILLGGAVSRRFEQADGLALGMAISCLVLIPMGAVSAGTALVQPMVLVMGLGVAVASSAIPYTLEMAALRRLPAGTFGILMSLEPAVAALAGFLVLGQSLALTQLVAIALVMIASAGATWSTRRSGPINPQ